MDGMGADVTQFHHPIPAEVALQREIPLLGVRDDEMARDSQREQKMRGNDSWTTAGTTNIWNLSGVTTGKTLNGAQAFFFSSRRRHTRLQGDWSSDVCSSD